jgi:phosphohistidine phosphatase
MILYIMRHAEAVDESDTLRDEWRYLTEKGRTASEKISSSLAKNGPKARITITSPLTRAAQTAEIAAEKACRKNVVVASELLIPGADMGELIAHLKEYKDASRIMLVGHEPQLGSLVAALLDRKNDSISLKRSACVALEFDPDKEGKPAHFLWYLTPG